MITPQKSTASVVFLCVVLGRQPTSATQLLAAKVKHNNNKWRYDGGAWTDTSRFDDSSGAKYEPFYLKCNKIKVDFVGGGSVTWEHDQAASLQEIFASNVQIYSDLGTSSWRNSGGNFAWQHHCNAQGFNRRITSSKARFGLLMNQENDCNSPDTSIGIGLTHRDRTVWSGGAHNCCQNGGRGGSIGLDAHVYVDDCGVLAAVVKGSNTNWKYDSSWWTSYDVFNGNNGRKTDAFSNLSCNKVVVRFKRNADGRTGIGWKHNRGKSLREIFAGGAVGSSIPADNWRQSGGAIRA